MEVAISHLRLALKNLEAVAKVAIWQGELATDGWNRQIWIIYPLQRFHYIWVTDNFTKRSLRGVPRKRCGIFVAHEKISREIRCMLLEIKCQEHDIGSEDMRILASLLPIFRQNNWLKKKADYIPLNQSWHKRFPPKISFFDIKFQPHPLPIFS